MKRLRGLLAEANQFIGTEVRKRGSRRATRRAKMRIKEQTRVLNDEYVPPRTTKIVQPRPRAKPRNIKVGNADWENRGVEYYNKYLPKEQQTAPERVDDLLSQGKNKRKFYQKPERSSAIKEIRFLNPGNEKIYEAIVAIKQGSALPSWAIHFKDQLTVQGGKLYLQNRLILLKEQKHNLVKKSFFNPKLPSTPRDIYEKYENQYANLTRKDCINALKTIETYQLLFRRRRPPNITGRMRVNRPGVLAVDCFFPTELHGWKGKRCILACTDVWSRFVGAYVCRDKEKETVGLAFEQFLKDFVKASGVLPRRVLADKGSELKEIPRIMERFRRPADGNKPLVLNSLTGTPINFVEHVNAHFQRYAQIHQHQVDGNFDVLVKAISYQINNKPRKDKGNLSPLQLLQLGRNQRQTVNRNYIDRVPLGRDNMTPINPGDRVRLLTLTRKEQVDPKKKGFAEKWSREIYTVLKKNKIRKNAGFHNYYLTGLPKPRYRHELLKIPRELDSVVPQITNKLGRPRIYESSTRGSSEYRPPG